MSPLALDSRIQNKVIQTCSQLHLVLVLVTSVSGSPTPSLILNYQTRGEDTDPSEPRKISRASDLATAKGRKCQESWVSSSFKLTLYPIFTRKIHSPHSRSSRRLPPVNYTFLTRRVFIGLLLFFLSLLFVQALRTRLFAVAAVIVIVVVVVVDYRRKIQDFFYSVHENDNVKK
ncbi:MAG: hypothetical protein JOS17DRAFT_214736 [Linnemannia elongata]|nr:MAG: hypothetical protein JOS17DRAFT_214736 [Linnemannia elongata]